MLPRKITSSARGRQIVGLFFYYLERPHDVTSLLKPGHSTVTGRDGEQHSTAMTAPQADANRARKVNWARRDVVSYGMMLLVMSLN